MNGLEDTRFIESLPDYSLLTFIEGLKDDADEGSARARHLLPIALTEVSLRVVAGNTSILDEVFGPGLCKEHQEQILEKARRDTAHLNGQRGVSTAIPDRRSSNSGVSGEGRTI